MGLKLTYYFGQTPIDEEEKEELLIETISTSKELDEFEQQNIEEALQWLWGREFQPSDIFSEKLIRNIHHRMFENVWGWAGTFRKREKNLGVKPFKIPIELKKVCDDAKNWFSHDSYSPDEIALRFKHRIVQIHCFPSGNGRHSRLMADIISKKLYRKPPFSWGAAHLYKSCDVRKKYIEALRRADKGDYQLLFKFARS